MIAAKAKSQNRCEMPPMRFLGQFCGVPEGKAVLSGCSQNRRFFALQFSREKCKMSPLDWQSAFNSESDCPRALESFSLISRAIPAPPSDSRRQAQTVPFPSTPPAPPTRTKSPSNSPLSQTDPTLAFFFSLHTQIISLNHPLLKLLKKNFSHFSDFREI